MRRSWGDGRRVGGGKCGARYPQSARMHHAEVVGLGYIRGRRIEACGSREQGGWRWWRNDEVSWLGEWGRKVCEALVGGENAVC